MCKLDERQRIRFQNYSQDLRTRKTILTPLFGFIALFLEFLPFPLLLTWAKKSCKCVKEHSVVEIYVAGFLFAEIVILLSVKSQIPPLWAVILITIFLGFRLVDVAQSWVNIFLVKPEAGILYPVRSLILVLINYIELILSLSVLGYIWNSIFNPAIDTLAKSILFTLGTMTAIGSKYEPVSFGAWAIYIAEIGFGLFFLIVVIVRTLTFFEAKRKDD